ncbi:MAG: succinylglutamate desuccinylase/aspartoacylase family protein [Gammaproteobacteria bacterium]|nr:succinylglutamate desuccinylase/aspartoacylase family protein [Gammaproteobacteria bacterium]
MPEIPPGGEPRPAPVPSPAQAEPVPVVPAPDETGYVVAPSLQLLGAEVFSGQRAELKWTAGQSFGGRTLDVPVLVAHGLKVGPVLCLTAAVHGDELNGVEIVRRVIGDLEPKDLSGTVIGVPIVNLLGFLRGSRYLPDRRDLNRYFPGNPRGSAASRIAYLFFEQIIRHCNYLVDFHTGSLDRTNLPQLRADLSDPGVFEFTQHFGATAVLHHDGATGTLRRVASEAGIPAVTFELGEPRTLQIEHVDFGVLAVDTLIDKLGMMKRSRLWAEKQPVFYASRWVRSDQGGILITNVKLGAKVGEGDVLGTVTNPLSTEVMQVRSPFNGRVLGMALNQFVLPGFAAFHIGIATREPDELMKAEMESGTRAPSAPDRPDTEDAPELEEGAGERSEYD